jgi:hypothetical protein
MYYTYSVNFNGGFMTKNLTMALDEALLKKARKYMQLIFLLKISYPIGIHSLLPQP